MADSATDTADLDSARALLGSGRFTCVLCKGDVTLTSEERGVAPLLAWLDSGQDLSGFSAADKIVGRAAAFLYVLMDVTAVYADVMSEGGRDVLAAQGIAASAATTTARIVNRAGTGPCPMEDAVSDTDDPAEAHAAIVARLGELRRQNTSR